MNSFNLSIRQPVCLCFTVHHEKVRNTGQVMHQSQQRPTEYAAQMLTGCLPYPNTGIAFCAINATQMHYYPTT